MPVGQLDREGRAALKPISRHEERLRRWRLFV
jgi:hypothetical protein